MALSFLFDPNKQFQSLGGVNEVSGFLRVFLNGTDDRATTYKNFDGTLNEADIVLDSYGRAVVIVDDTKTYRIEVYNRLGGLMWTVSNYKARGGSGGGTGTPVSVEGTVGEIDVDENTEGGVKHFVIGLASTIKNAITALQLAVNSIGLSLNGKKDKQSPVSVSGGTTKTLVGITQDENGEILPEFDDIAFPDWTSAINSAVATCEKLENKKTTVTGYESSNTYYPTIKAVVDFVNGMLQNLGGKLITDNGDPFTSSASLPSSTPYGGVDIADKDYAYVQGVGTAERWSATVNGSSVTWLQEYAISIPVFTPSQQAAIDSGVTSAMLGTFLTKTGNGSDVTASFTTAGSRNNISTGEKLSVIFGKIAKWFGDLKAVAFSGNYSDLIGTPTIPTAYTSSPNMDGSASAGSSGSWSRGDHTHPHDTSKQDLLPYSSGKYGISISGSSDSVSKTSLGQVNTLPVASMVSSDFKAGTFLLKATADGGSAYSFGDITIPNNQWYKFTVNGESSNYCVITLEIVAGSASSAFGTFKLLVDSGSVKKVVRVPYATKTAAVGSVTTPVYVDGNGELKECSLPSSVQTWSGTSYVSGLVEYSGGVYRIKADIPMNHSFGSGSHGFVNYEIFATALANKGTCKCSYSITPKYTGGGSGIAFVGMMPGQFIEGSSNVTPKTSLHVSGIGSCSLADATYLPNSLGVEIIVETSDWSVGDSVNFILNVSIIKN